MAGQAGHLTLLLAAVSLASGCDGVVGRAQAAPEAAAAATAAEPLSYSASRLVLFEGQAGSVGPRGRPHSPVAVDPPLPSGLTLDPQRGVVSGTPRRAAPGRVHLLRDARGATARLWVEVLDRPRPGEALYAAPSGSDDNPGTIDRPLRTVARAAARLRPGMTLYLRGGVYRGDTELQNLRGTEKAPIAIRSYPGERAVLDASETTFAEDPRRAWEKAKGPGAHPDEWISTRAYPVQTKDSTSRGAFLDRAVYTRLLTYSRIEDLRAANQTYDQLAVDDARPGPKTERTIGGNTDPNRPRRPWVYFGPGLHYDQQTGRIHIRLSPTHHGVKGLEEYSGPRDPRELHLAISSRNDHALGLVGSQHVRVANLSLHHGGDDTVLIRASSDVTLDHVEIRASTNGLNIGTSDRVRVLNTRLDGGIPEWSFRSDFKARYQFEVAPGKLVHNDVVSKTHRALIYMAGRNSDIEVAYSELENGHDAYVGGAPTNFHHNRIRNVHDEAFYITAADGAAGMRIHHNVIEKVLSGLSFRDGKSMARRSVYRNVFDLREPTAGHRPDGQDRQVWRWGHLFKAAGAIGGLYFYQNTALVSRSKGKAAFVHFAALEPDGIVTRPRWILNNLFVVVPSGDPDSPPFAIVPHPRYLQAVDSRGRSFFRSDGNLWVRTEPSGRPMFRCVSRLRGERCKPKKFPALADLVAARLPGNLEAHSRSSRDPGFRRLARLDTRSAGDNLRPGPRSSARRAGIALPTELIDPERTARPDIGALAADQGALRVGVNGRLAY